MPRDTGTTADVVGTAVSVSRYRSSGYRRPVEDQAVNVYPVTCVRSNDPAAGSGAVTCCQYGESSSSEDVQRRVVPTVSVWVPSVSTHENVTFADHESSLPRPTHQDRAVRPVRSAAVNVRVRVG